MSALAWKTGSKSNLAARRRKALMAEPESGVEEGAPSRGAMAAGMPGR